MTVANSSLARQVFPPDPLPSIILGGSVNLLAGVPGVGKTALLAWILTRFRDRLPLFGRLPNPVPKIAFLSVDRSWQQSSRAWFELVGYSDIVQYSLQDDMEFDVDRLEHRRNRMKIFNESLDKLEPFPLGTLVIVDPIAPFLGGNLLDYDACMVACARIRRSCLRRGITLIGDRKSVV